MLCCKKCVHRNPAYQIRNSYNVVHPKRFTDHNFLFLQKIA